MLKGEAEQRLLDLLLEKCLEKGWIKDRLKQRSDSTHVVAAIRSLNRLELVGETLRATLNVLAEVAPDWLLKQVGRDWFDRYSKPVEEYRLPKGKKSRQNYAETIGRDGMQLLSAIYENTGALLVAASSARRGTTATDLGTSILGRARRAAVAKR